MSLDRENLKTGYNTVRINGAAKVDVNGGSFSSECSEEITVFVEPEVIFTPEPTRTPGVTPTPIVSATPSIKRRW